MWDSGSDGWLYSSVRLLVLYLQHNYRVQFGVEREARIKMDIYVFGAMSRESHHFKLYVSSDKLLFQYYKIGIKI